MKKKVNIVKKLRKNPLKFRRNNVEKNANFKKDRGNNLNEIKESRKNVYSVKEQWKMKILSKNRAEKANILKASQA